MDHYTTTTTKRVSSNKSYNHRQSSGRGHWNMETEQREKERPKGERIVGGTLEQVDSLRFSSSASTLRRNGSMQVRWKRAVSCSLNNIPDSYRIRSSHHFYYHSRGSCWRFRQPGQGSGEGRVHRSWQASICFGDFSKHVPAALIACGRWQSGAVGWLVGWLARQVDDSDSGTL